MCTVNSVSQQSVQSQHEQLCLIWVQYSDYCPSKIYPGGSLNNNIYVFSSLNLHIIQYFSLHICMKMMERLLCLLLAPLTCFIKIMLRFIFPNFYCNKIVCIFCLWEIECNPPYILEYTAKWHLYSFSICERKNLSLSL